MYTINTTHGKGSKFPTDETYSCKSSLRTVYKPSVPPSSRQRPPEPLIRLLYVQLQLPRLLVAQLLGGAHLVERDEPLDDLAAVVKVLVGDLVDGLDDVGEERVQLVLGEQAELDGVEEGDELLRGLEDEDAADVLRRAAGLGVCRRVGRGRGGWGDGRGGEADAEAFCGSWDFEL